MKTKKLLFAATAILAFASCSEDTYVGEQNPQNPVNNNGSAAIAFNSASKSITRAITGAEAAKLLNKNFVVEGIKTVDAVTTEVFDNYNVNYVENTAATTASNTANWEYVGLAANSHSGLYDLSGTQTIKYWDFAATRYDFWAYSLGGGNATVVGMDHNATLTSSAYTITGTQTDLEKVYISDLVTAYHTSSANSPHVGDQVDLTFRSFLSKIRIGLYETIPGYSVKDVKFYTAAAASPSSTPALYATGSVLPAFNGSNQATFKVYFPTNTVGNPDYNVAHVEQTSSDKASYLTLNNLTYGVKERHELTTGTNNWLGRYASSPTWAGDGSYVAILPYETGEVLTLKVDYTLEPIDGTTGTIKVTGATAIIPAQYTKWKANFAYTYLFKISDNTNGRTDPAVAKEGLYPITFDAVVVSNEEGTQETITTVATPSITTYSITSNVVTNNEYTTSDDIYVTASTDGTLMSMTDKATLYNITKSSSAYAATEAEVLAALNIYSTKSDGSAPYTYTGRNSVMLTPVSDALNLSGTTIPTVDGQTVGVTAGQAALIDKSKLTAAHYYAFVFETTSGTPTTADKVEPVTPTSGTDVTKYYTDAACTMPATGTADGSTTYYDKYTEVSGASYAIKVIKVN